MARFERMFRASVQDQVAIVEWQIKNLSIYIYKVRIEVLFLPCKVIFDADVLVLMVLKKTSC